MAMSLEKMADEKTRILDGTKGEKEKSPMAAAPTEEQTVGILPVFTHAAANHSILPVGWGTIPSGGPPLWRVPGQGQARRNSLRGT